MEERNNSGCMAVYVLDALAGFVLWVLLTCLKAAGVVSMHWAVVLSGLVWIPCAVFAFTVLAAALVRLIAKVKRWRRRRKADRRIIAKSKAVDVWDASRIVLGGRALELKAWEDFKIRRKRGETDAELRRRCMTAADNQLANTPREGGHSNE